MNLSVGVSPTEIILLSFLLVGETPTNRKNRVVVKKDGVIKIIPVADINYLEADDDYVKLRLTLRMNLSVGVSPTEMILLSFLLVDKIPADRKNDFFLEKQLGAKIIVSPAFSYIFFALRLRSG